MVIAIVLAPSLSKVPCFSPVIIPRSNAEIMFDRLRYTQEDRIESNVDERETEQDLRQDFTEREAAWNTPDSGGLHLRATEIQTPTLNTQGTCIPTRSNNQHDREDQ